MRSRSFLHLGRWLGVLAFLATLCVASVTGPAVAPTTSSAPVTTPTVSVPATVAPSVSTTTSTVAPEVDIDDVLLDISMTSVPPDVIVPTRADSLDEQTNPINGRRGGTRPLPENLECAIAPTPTCLNGMLDVLGFDVTTGSSDDRERSARRAIAVLQLDAGFPVTGVHDDNLLEYLGIDTEPPLGSRADEERQIGMSQQGRPIVALRYGDGPKTVLVVGLTHGDEEGGLRVLLRARSLPLPEEITLWVVPTMNPDGLVLDTRFLTNGADPNRLAPSYPEQQAVYDFALATGPSLSVWYHQNYGWVGGSGASMVPARQYQELTALGSLYRSGDCAKGFMWCPIDEALGSSSILVELPDVLTPADVQIHARALLAVASGNIP